MWTRFWYSLAKFYFLITFIEISPMALLRTYRIETERVVIRCYEPSDAAAMSETILANHEHLIPWMPWAVKGQHTVPFCLELIRSFRGYYDLGKDYRMGVFDRRDGRYIGGTGLHPRVGDGAFEIGYWIDHRVARQEFATHVASALTKTAFEFEGVHRMNIRMQVDNVASQRIPERLGYKREGILRQYIPLGEGKFADVHLFSMLREEFDASDLPQLPVKVFGFDGQALFQAIPLSEG
jgi:RimJ/RimL family protein N-acetyltransferase